MALISCLVVMVCVIYPSTMLSLIIYNFPSVFKISFLFAENFVYRFCTAILCIFSIYSLSLVHLRLSLLRTVLL